MVIDDEKTDKMYSMANDLSSKIDEVITDFVDESIPEDDAEAAPFVIIASLVNILNKLAVLIGEGRRDPIIALIDDMMFSDEEIRKYGEAHNVVDINSRRH